MMQPTPTAFLLLLSAALSSATLDPADCSTCDDSLTQPLHYGCNGNAYVTYNDEKISCGQALTLDQLESVPKFYYPDADKNGLYALLMIDTWSTDPNVGTISPFLPFPIIHYGAMNIPGDVLQDGVDMGAFYKDASGKVRGTPFVEYQKPVPSEDLNKEITPGEDVPDLNKRAFNYEFMLAKQKYEKSDPKMDKYENWEFIGFLKRNTDINTVVSTYVSTGYCVKETEEGAYGSDCLVSATVNSGTGCVPAHVVNSDGGTPCAEVAGGSEYDNGDDTSGAGEPGPSGSDPSTESSDSSSSSAGANRWKSAAVLFSLFGMICGSVAI